MTKQYYERHSLAVALQPYLVTQGWTGVTTVYEGFASDKQIVVPFVSVYFLPSRGQELQMGRGTQRSFIRNIQVDAYMESESRAMSIADDVYDFIDGIPIAIVDPSSVTVGTLYNSNSELITINVLPPNMAQPKVIRWRAIIQAPLEAHYNA